jgi:hypothetical protein
MRLTVALRSPLVFRLPGGVPVDALTAPPDAVAIGFEGRDFVWHPPMDLEDDSELTQYGPMVSVALADEGESGPAAESLQRFLSAAAFKYDEPVEDVHHGGPPGRAKADPFNLHATRAQRAYFLIKQADAPASLRVTDDPALWLTLALYREGKNAGSPFYKCLAFSNALDATHDVERETVSRAQTLEAARRDDFIDALAPIVAGWFSLPTPGRGWPHYLRHEVRNALAHVHRRRGRTQVNPDTPADRVRLRADADMLEALARIAVDHRWPAAVTAVPREVKQP